jgi:hypothetical protein
MHFNDGLSPFLDLGPTHATPRAAPLRVRAAAARSLLVEEAALAMLALAPTVLSTMTLVLMPTRSLTMTAQVCIPYCIRCMME